MRFFFDKSSSTSCSINDKVSKRLCLGNLPKWSDMYRWFFWIPWVKAHPMARVKQPGAVAKLHSLKVWYLLTRCLAIVELPNHHQVFEATWEVATFERWSCNFDLTLLLANSLKFCSWVASQCWSLFGFGLNLHTVSDGYLVSHQPNWPMLGWFGVLDPVVDFGSQKDCWPCTSQSDWLSWILSSNGSRPQEWICETTAWNENHEKTCWWTKL